MSCDLSIHDLLNTNTLEISEQLPYSINFGGKKLWRIWQIAFNSPKFFSSIILDDHRSTLSNYVELEMKVNSYHHAMKIELTLEILILLEMCPTVISTPWDSISTEPASSLDIS